MSEPVDYTVLCQKKIDSYFSRIRGMLTGDTPKEMELSLRLMFLRQEALTFVTSSDLSSEVKGRLKGIDELVSLCYNPL